MVPGVVGRPSSAAGPAGPLRIAHCTGQHRRPQLLDAVTPTPNRSAYERGRRGTQLWRPPAERRWPVGSRQLSVQIPTPLRAEPLASCLWKDHDSERVELVFLPDLIVLAGLAAVAVEHVARQAVPGLTAVEQVVNARRWYPDFTHTDRQGQAA